MNNRRLPKLSGAEASQASVTLLRRIRRAIRDEIGLPGMKTTDIIVAYAEQCYGCFSPLLKGRPVPV